MADKNISVSLDLEKFNSQLKEQKEEADYSDFEEVSPRSSVFVLGKDPRVSSLHISTPNLINIELLKDGLNNVYTQLNWQLKREDIDSRTSSIV